MSKEAQQALDKMAENARELGLDYEQPAPVQKELGRNHWEDGDVFERIAESKKQPAQQQEPVAIALNTGTKQGVKWLKNVEHGEHLYTSPPTLSLAQRTWVGLTEDEADKIYKDGSTFGEMMRMVEAKLRSKNEDRN